MLVGLTLATIFPVVAEPPQDVPKWEIPPGVELPPDFPVDRLDEFEINPFEIMEPEDLPEHMRPQAELRGERVPYAVRAHSLLDMLGSVANQQEGDWTVPPLASMLETLGLDPGSEAAAELINSAMDFSIAYRQDLHSRIKPVVRPLEVQHEVEVATYRDAGAVFGKWLRAREAEGWALAPFLERLLNYPGRGLTMVSTDQAQGELEKDVAEYEEAFRDGIHHELGWVPRRFQ